MADRVAHIRGATVDRDFFGWRMADIADRATDTIVIDGGATKPAADYFPQGFTRDEMVQLSWRIKTFTIQGSMNYQTIVDTSPGTATVDHVWTIQSDWVSHPTQVATEAQVGSGSFPNAVVIQDATREYQLVGPPNPNLTEFEYSSGTWHWVGPPTYIAGRYLAFQAGSVTPFGNLGFMAGDSIGFLEEIYSPLPPIIAVTGSLSASWCFYDCDGCITPNTPTIRSQDFDPGFSLCDTEFIIMGQSPQGHSDDKVPQGQVYYDSENDLFYPFLLFSMLDGPWIGGCGSVGVAQSGVSISTINVSGTDLMIGTITILGHAIPLYVNSATFAGATLSITPQTSNFVLTPVSYWPYQNSLGQPVYDTTSGSQINDPFA